MGVDLGGIQVLMAQNFLKGAHIHAVLQHQRGGGMAQLVGGIFAAVQPRGLKALLEHIVDAVLCDPRVPPGDKQRVGVRRPGLASDLQPVLNGILTGRVEVDGPLLVTLAQHPQTVFPNVGDIQAYQFGNTQTAVQKQGDDAVVPFRIVSVNGFQKPDALVQRQIAWQRLPDLGRIQLLNGIFLQKFCLID